MTLRPAGASRRFPHVCKKATRRQEGRVSLLFPEQCLATTQALEEEVNLEVVEQKVRRLEGRLAMTYTQSTVSKAQLSRQPG